ncbi:hypothetical protein ACQ4PT_031489 [Festuca glaucescens]
MGAAAFFCLLLSLWVQDVTATDLGFTRSDFPHDFAFGAGTSAYQYEGAVAEDGRSPSSWDNFTHAGKMEDKSTGDVAADGYHKYMEDVKIMSETGLEAYRFSISWSRLIPNGSGAVNLKGLEYYNNLIDELVNHDLPQIVEDKYGGWLSPRIVILEPLVFGDYPEVMKKNVGSRLPPFTKNQSELIKGSLDFIGINHYYSLYVNDRPLETGVRDYNMDMSIYVRGSRTDPPPPAGQGAPTNVPSDPKGLQLVLEYLKGTYGNLPIYIQENGKHNFPPEASMGSADGSLDDTDRIAYLSSYMESTLHALRNGVNVRGYFAWAFMDLFELLSGYQSRYGLYSVDFADERRPRRARLSARWYSAFLKEKAGTSALLWNAR